MPEKISETDAFVLLAKRRRRLALRVLRESSTPMTAIELADRIERRESEDPSVGELRSVYLALHHNHLPRLEASDVVSYDRDDGRVRPGPNFDVLVRMLEETDELDLSWSDG